MFEKIINNPNIQIIFRTFAINHLCELLLDDYIFSGDEEALQELERHINNLYDIGQDGENYPVIIQSLILQAKLKIIEENYKGAIKILEVAQVFATERGLTGLENKIFEEKNLVTEHLENNSFQTGSKRDRLDIVKLGNYIQKVQKINSEI